MSAKPTKRKVVDCEPVLCCEVVGALSLAVDQSAAIEHGFVGKATLPFKLTSSNPTHFLQNVQLATAHRIFSIF